MSTQQAPQFNRRPTPGELAEMEHQAKELAKEIAVLFDAKALPIPVVLKSLLVCYQALAVAQPLRDTQTSSFFLRRSADNLLMHIAKADPYGTADQHH